MKIRPKSNDHRPRVQVDLEPYQRAFLTQTLPWGTQNSFFRLFCAKAVELLKNNPSAMQALVTGTYDIVPREAHNG